MEKVLTDSEARRFHRAQWRMLLATMFCYFFFYTGRQTFSYAIPGIEQELGISKTALGWVIFVAFWTYAFGQAVNGNLGDKFGGRRLMSLGAVLSCVLSWVVSFGTSFMALLIPWTLNGYAQSMGWAPGSRVLSNWSPHDKRGKVYGAYVFAAGMGTVLAFVAATLILQFDLDWRWIFRLPVLLLLLGGITYYLIVRDRPEDMGFPPLHEEENSNGDNEDMSEGEISGETSWERYRHALSNFRFMIASLAIGFQSLTRYGLINWVPVHFLGKDWKESPDKWISIALPVGMALGAMAGGWLSDNCFRGNRWRVIGLFMFLAAGCSLSMFLLPKGHLLCIPMLFLTGFFAYGPQSAFWALCPDLLGNQRAGTGTGVMDTSAYIFAGLSGPLIGWLMDATGQTSVVFAVVAVSCLIGAMISPLIRK